MPAPLKVFDMESCQRRLSRGYITLLFGVAAASDAGRELLANTELWSHLASMGCQVRCSMHVPNRECTTIELRASDEQSSPVTLNNVAILFVLC